MSVNFDLKAIADDVTAELLGDPFFSALPSTSGSPIVASEDPKDIDTEIQTKLNEIGLGVIVLQPSARSTRPNQKGPFFDKVEVTIKVYENPTANRSINGGANPTAAQAAVAIAGIIHQFFPPSINESFYVTECIPVIDPDYNLWQVTARTAAGVFYPRTPIAPVVATPSTPGAAEVVLSCATPGACIFYTLDGTYPSPRNPTSHLYIAGDTLVDDAGIQVTTDSGVLVAVNGGFSLVPLNIAAGSLLRARAWLAGYAPSNTAELTVQY